MNRNLRIDLGAALMLLASGPVFGLASDSDQPINLEADWAERDDVKQTTIYKGAVVVTQGTMRISGDKVTMHYDDEGEPEKIIVTGKLARFRQRADGADTYQRAKARRMEFFPKKDLVILVREADYSDGQGFKISGERIVYNTVTGNARAASTASGRATTKAGKPKGRVKITIQSKKKKK